MILKTNASMAVVFPAWTSKAFAGLSGAAPQALGMRGKRGGCLMLRTTPGYPSISWLCMINIHDCTTPHSFRILFF